MTAPIVQTHAGIWVVRDDLHPGGTKARFIGQVFDGVQEAVYASPPEGGAQTALAHVARALGKKAPIFVAQRAKPHARTLEAARMGAKVVSVSPGYLTVVQSRARQYCRDSGASLIPFGADIPGSVEALAAAALATGLEPDEVWCAAGSGVWRGVSRLLGRKPGGTLCRSGENWRGRMSPGPAFTSVCGRLGRWRSSGRRSRQICTMMRRLRNCA